jgi:hypothetical protein
MEKPKQKPKITYQHGGWMLLSRRGDHSDMLVLKNTNHFLFEKLLLNLCIVNFLIYFYYSVLRSSEQTTSAIMVERQQQQQQQQEQEQEHEQTPPPTTSSSEKDQKLTLLRLRLERMKICNDNASNYIVRLFRKLVQQEKYKRIRHGFILIQAIQRGKQYRKLNTCIIEHMKEFAIRQQQQGRNTMMTTKKTNVTL